MGTKYVGYLRVSTDRQGVSGLGIEAQRRRILDFVNGDAEVVDWLEEHESGKHADRPALARALDKCELTGAVLVIATLDRLTRDEAFLRTVRDRGVEFRCADLPFADPFVLDIMARIARYEREKISERTKAALAVAKSRGVKLGNPRGAAPLVEHRQRGAETAGRRHGERADVWARKRAELIAELEARGVRSHNAIAREMNARGILTRQKGKWTATSVRRLRERLAAGVLAAGELGRVG